MRLTMPSGIPEGIPLTVMPFREDAVIGTMSLATLQGLRRPCRRRAPRSDRRSGQEDPRRSSVNGAISGSC